MSPRGSVSRNSSHGGGERVWVQRQRGGAETGEEAEASSERQVTHSSRVTQEGGSRATYNLRLLALGWHSSFKCSLLPRLAASTSLLLLQASRTSNQPPLPCAPYFDRQFSFLPFIQSPALCACGRQNNASNTSASQSLNL